MGFAAAGLAAFFAMTFVAATFADFFATAVFVGFFATTFVVVVLTALLDSVLAVFLVDAFVADFFANFKFNKAVKDSGDMGLCIAIKKHSPFCKTLVPIEIYIFFLNRGKNTGLQSSSRPFYIIGPL
ncbi:MAG: hypothetical protein J6T46_15345 [Victivallales bacterium]|nr:hypothetical protein [Victivallales bacterium]